MTATSETAKALQLAKLGIYVFPVLVTDDPENPYKKLKRPAIPYAHKEGDPLYKKCKGECGRFGHGFYDATLDPGVIQDFFERYPKARVGVYAGKSGLALADFDVKRDANGTIKVNGLDNFFGKWWEYEDTFRFQSVSESGGEQWVFEAPDGLNLPPKADYRGIKGMDRRTGPSYSVWNGPVPSSRDEFKTAPEWLLDTSTVRSEVQFEGTVKEWFEGLEPGEPSEQVRKAIKRAEYLFVSQGNDLSHSDLIERSYEAIRLGAERHSGVPVLLETLERLATSREGDHSRNPDEWAYEFQEGLASGITKAGDTIALAKSIPPFNVSLIPQSVDSAFFTDRIADVGDLRTLAGKLQREGVEDLATLSVLWGSVATRDAAREFGLENTWSMICRNRDNPAPLTENPSLADVTTVHAGTSLLTPEERALVADHPTFIDDYLTASYLAKGYNNRAIDVPAAWTLLNLVYGTRAFLPMSKKLEMNTWHIILAPSGSGKSTALEFYNHIADTFTIEQETRYRVAANSSPDGLEVSLLEREDLPTVVYADEASGWLKNIAKKDWMSSLTDRLSEWYDGHVFGSNNLARKEYRGKSANTSLGMLMAATPELFTKLLDSEMFEQGFLARVNWSWAEDAPEDDESRYFMDFVEFSDHARVPVQALEVLTSMAAMKACLPDGVVRVGVEAGVQARLATAGKLMADVAKAYDEANSGVTSPSARRTGPQTAWKCAALLALSAGRTEINMVDALTALTYVETWFDTLFRVVEAAGNGDFNRDVDEIEKYVRSRPQGVTRPALLYRFRNMIVRSPRELDDRVDFLLSSGRITRKDGEGKVKYEVNGTADKQKETEQ